MVGDERQLPAVCPHNNHGENGVPSVCQTCHMYYSPDWVTSEHHTLTEVFRQRNDVPYMQFLNAIRTRPPTQQELRTLDPAIIDEKDIGGYTQDDTTFICSHNNLVHKHNKRMLHRLYDASQIVQVKSTCDKILPPAPHPIHDWMFGTAHNPLSELAVGARVVITENVKAPHFVNGANALVHAFVYNDIGTMTGITLTTATTAKRYTLSRTAMESRRYGPVTYEKFSFPLQLGYAVNAHKCQGMTITTHTIIHIKSIFSPGMLYVMLSRVSELKHLKIAGSFGIQDFTTLPPRPP
jgi:ATP-dependent exoDNAse (exonuclease V) alpha subunit